MRGESDHRRAQGWGGLTEGGGSNLVLQERLEVDLNKKGKVIQVGVQCDCERYG